MEHLNGEAQQRPAQEEAEVASDVPDEVGVVVRQMLSHLVHGLIRLYEHFRQPVFLPYNIIGRVQLFNVVLEWIKTKH